MSVNSAMTAIADKIRTLLGISGKMGLDSMASNLSTAQDEVAAQENLISQIAAALEGKGGSTGTGASATIASASVTPSSNSTSISFSGLSGDPKLFYMFQTGSITGDKNNRFCMSVQYDGETIDGLYQSGEKVIAYSNAYFSKSYAGNTLTITTSSSTNGGYFKSGVSYKLVYLV